MIGIKNIGVYICEERVPNIDKRFEAPISMEFLENKLGIVEVARKADNEAASDLCVKAMQDLLSREPSLDLNQVDCVVVCTQNGDYHLPQTSAILQHKLGLSSRCASFDISLGCSGYVYSLQIVKSFMETNGLRYGLLFTSDPYSTIIDPQDKDTDLIFGDGAAVTLLSDEPAYSIEKGAFFTDGSEYDFLIKRAGKPLYMNGRGIFNFALRRVPPVINECLAKNETTVEQVELFLLHQGSKYIVETLVSRMHIPAEKVPVMIYDYGNTVSSSIPIMLQRSIAGSKENSVLVCGFGVGLSVAATMLKRMG